MSLVSNTILYYFSGLVAQTFAFGGYTVVFGLSTRMLLQKRDGKRLTRILILMVCVMFFLASFFWAYNVAYLVGLLRALIVNPEVLNSDAPAHEGATKYLAFFNALALVNYDINDAFIVWRARRICAPEHRKYMYLPVFFVALTALAVLGLIGLRTILFFPSTDAFARTVLYLNLIDGVQIWALIVSLVSNTLTTAVVGFTAWQHRKTIQEGLKKSTPGSKILIILLESGLIYLLAGIFSLTTALIKLPFGTLGDVYFPFNVQLASAYTPIVLLLVNTHQQPSMKDPSFVGSLPNLNLDILLEPSPNQTVLGSEEDAFEGTGALSEKDAQQEQERGHRYASSEHTLV